MIRGLFLATALVALIAIAVVCFLMRDVVQLPLLAAGGLLSGLGLLSLLGWISGLIGVKSSNGERPFFDALMDAAGDAVVVTDRKGRAIYSNAQFLKLAGKAGASRLIGMDVLYAGYPEFAEPIYQISQAVLEGKALHRDIRVAAGSSIPGSSASEARWLRVSASPLQGAQQAGQAVWRLTDITGDRQHQESAFARLQFIITYLDHAPAGFFSTLPDGKVDYVNATLANWLGIDLLAAQNGALRLEQLVGSDAAHALRALEPEKGGSRTAIFPVDIRTSSGASLSADIVHRTDFDAEGKALPSRSMVLKRDSTTNTSGAQTAADFMRLLSYAPIGLGEVTADGILVTANASLLALSPQIKLQGKLAAALDANGKQEFELALERAHASVGVRVPLSAQFTNTEPRSAALTLVRLEGQDTVVVFAEDKTERRALEVQLAQSQKMQAVGQLASGIAHDFNNVLTPIIGFADLLLTKMRPTDSAFADVMNIKQNANRAANLVRQLLAFSRKQTMQLKPVVLTDAMSDLSTNLLSRTLGEKIGLEISHGRDLGYVMLDIHQFEQVIINLAVNARDAMPQGGRLTLKTYNHTVSQMPSVGHNVPPGEYVVCEVADSGSGMPKEVLDKIWEPFFSTKEVGKGTGLGLSMVYGIIKQSGGFIFCDSEIGQGTTFTIYLPRHYPEKSTQPVADDKVDAKREDFSGKGRILVVEDEDAVRAFTMRALQSRGYQVVEASSGEAGLEAIAADKEGFELILSDVVMPEMDGPTMLSEIRKRGIKSKFIFMSGYAEDAFERNLENPGDFDFLQKPFSLKQLLEKVKDTLG